MNALRLSQELKIASRVRGKWFAEELKPLSPLEEYLMHDSVGSPEEFNGRHIDLYDSMSIWDNAEVRDTSAGAGPGPARDGTVHRRVSIDEFEFEPREYFEDEREQVRDLKEFCRILVWDPESFDVDQAAQCIRFHHLAGFPLFWLNPKTLLGRKGQPRLKLGHLTVLALNLVERRNGGNVTSPAGRAVSLLNYESGVEPLRAPGGHYQVALDDAWGAGNRPDGLKGDGTCLDEVLYLLKRADLMLAIDAWGMRKLGPAAWQELSQTLAKQDVQAWAQRSQSSRPPPRHSQLAPRLRPDAAAAPRRRRAAAAKRAGGGGKKK